MSIIQKIYFVLSLAQIMTLHMLARTMPCQLCPTNLDGQAQIWQIPRGNTTTNLGSPTAEAWADHQEPSHSRMGNLEWI